MISPRRTSIRRLLFGALISVGLSGTAQAADEMQALLPICSSCHGATGQSVAPNFPKLAGQHEAYLRKQLQDFRSGSRKDPAMSPMATGLSDAQIDVLARFFAAQKP
ncbi:c-type cytochrome [Pseudomonas aeruginosa]|uniref:c-type cytochrome n=1 Tax=Pseudomonas aeruginosa TaxID=287 RepID=UPI000FD545CE|nr:cytochrome c [Pseudomonas aeruginosa]RUF08865.1 cytochrome c [Pseudomonas aeruginosa]